MFILKKVYLGIILSVVVLVICEDEKKAEEEEEKDPWDTSTDKYRHHLGNSKSSDTEEPVKIDVTEVSESEVHSSRSKLCKNCKTQAVVREEPNIDNSTKLHNSSLESRNIRKEIDEETKEQIKDAIDERDPADSEPKDTKTHTKHHGGTKKHGLSKKQLNHQIDFYPGSLWEYPYPYYHPQYGCGGKKGPCTPEAKPIEAKEDKKKEKVSGSVFPKIKGFGWIWKGPRVSEIGTSWGTPCWFNQEKKQFTCRQLVPSHYYGPPSAGWGGFQPGHTGGGWGTPYWYKKCAVPQRDCRQIIPSHYYGPPSAGWGGFQPGHTGGGWGTPYWYKKCQLPLKDCRQLVPSHYYGPPSAGWGGFKPGQTGSGWGTPFWYKRCETPQLNCRGYIPSPYQPNWLAGSSSIRSTDPWSQSGTLEARKHEVPLRYEQQLSNRLYSPRSIYTRYNIAALHEWISYLERQREKDRELERFRLKMKDRENERRYNMEVLHFKDKAHHLDTRSSEEDRVPLSYIVRPHSRMHEIDSPAIEYLFANHEGAIYND